MTSRVLVVGLVCAGLALQGCVVSRQPVTVLGRSVRITPAERDVALSGELIAVSAESVWVAPGAEIVSVPWSRVRRLQVRLSKVSGGGAMGYSVVMGLLTGGALFAACSQVEDTECAVVLPGVLGMWLVLGGLAAMSLESGSHKTLGAARWEELRAYARFPQGLPDGLPRHGPAPPGPRAADIR